MKYLSSYSVVIYNAESCTHANFIINEFRDECHDAKWALTETGDVEYILEWDYFESDVKKFSKKYPTIVFEFTRYGQGRGDYWKYFVRNGTMKKQQAQVLFDNFDITSI